MVETSNRYPMSLSVDYPERLNRLTTFFRIFTVIPIFIILALLVGGGSTQGSEAGGGNWQCSYGAGAAAITFLPLVLMLLFRKKYPRWWFD